MPEKPFVNKKYKLEKIPGKGGWTYARVPEIKPGRHTHFGWVKVKGSIDGVEIKKYHMMPLGDGNLFLPVKAEIRKKIKKQEGDWVHVILYPDNEPLQAPQEMLDCLADEPKALKFFQTLNEGERKEFIDWIYSAKKEETKIERMADAVNRLGKKQKFRLA